MEGNLGSTRIFRKPKVDALCHGRIDGQPYRPRMRVRISNYKLWSYAVVKQNWGYFNIMYTATFPFFFLE